MSDTATGGAAPIDLGFINPFDTTLVKEPASDSSTSATTQSEVATTTQQSASESATTTAADTTTTSIEQQDDIFDEVQYVKNTFGWDDVEKGKAELTELRRLKEQPITFANQESERLFNLIKEGKEAEVYGILDKKMKLSKADEMAAKDAISLHLQYSNPHYTAQDIEDVLEERYPKPPEPKAIEGEEPAEFEARKAEWNQTIEKINRRINRDALAAKDELKKLQSELVLPDINRVDPVLQQQAAQKELEAQQAREKYLQSVESDFNKVTGFKTTYKDKEVEIPVSYELTPEEKLVYKEKIKNLDLREYFGPRWFNQDGTPKVDRIIRDLYRLENEDKIDQKFVNDAASKRMDAYLKDKKNISLNGKQPEGTFQPSLQEETEKRLGEWAFAK